MIVIAILSTKSELEKIRNNGSEVNEIYRYSHENKKALKILESTTKIVNGHYEVELRWKEHVNLPKSRIVANLRLRSQQQRLITDSHLENLYQDTID